MDQLINSPETIVISLVNFLVVLIILNKFLFKKLNKSLTERQDKIRIGLENADNIDKKIAEIEIEKDKIIKEANQKANEIISEHTAIAEKSAKKIKEDAHEQAREIIEEARKKTEAERESLLEDLKTRTAELALLATEKILEDKLDKEADKKLIEKFLSNL